MTTTKNKWRLDDILFELDSLHGKIPIKIGQACEGIMAFGSTGSGKTSGSHDHILLAMMRRGFGILGLCAKPEEGQRLINLAKKAQRESDIVHVTLEGTERFNFLDSLAEGGALAVVAAFEQINQALTGASEKNEWSMAANQLLFNLIELFLLAGRRLELSSIRTTCTDFEAQKELLDDAINNVHTPEQDHSLKMVSNYFQREWEQMGDKTRASVLMSLTPALSPFCSGHMHTLFCTTSTFSPRDLRNGKIIVLNIPAVGDHAIYGRVAGIILKYMAQKTVETHFGNGKKYADETTRPVCIVADEAHYYATSKDSEFATTSRSLKGTLFYLTQNINNFWRRGGENVKADTATLLSNLHGIRLMHQNEDKDTYDWFMDILGKELKEKTSQSITYNTVSGSGTGSASSSLEYLHLLTQRDLQLGLARGGKKFRFVVTALLQQAGRDFDDNLFAQVAFRQFGFQK